MHKHLPNKEKIMAKEKFMRKIHCTLGTIGIDASTSELFHATSKVCTTDFSSYPMFESPFQEREYFVINMTCDADFVRYAPSIDACVLILDVTKKVPQKIKNLLKLAQQTCLFKVVVFLDNCDKITDAKQFKTILADIRKLLLSYKLDGSNAPIIRGSLKKAIEGQKTWLAKIEDFVKACDEYIKAPTRRDMPFLMPVEDVFQITGRGTVATGRVERGTLHLNDKVVCVGLGNNTEYVVTGIEMFRKSIDEALPGDNIGVLLRGASKNDVKPGMFIAAPNSACPHTEFKAMITLLTKEQGGRTNPFMKNYRPVFRFYNTNVNGTITELCNAEMAAPGETVTVVVKLSQPVVMEKRTPFTIRQGGREVGRGIVIEIIK